MTKSGHLQSNSSLISEGDVPEIGWLRTGVFLSSGQVTVINEAKRHETFHYIDGDLSYSISTSYKFYVRQFAEIAGLPSASMIFEITEDNELLIARWQPPGAPP